MTFEPISIDAGASVTAHGMLPKLRIDLRMGGTHRQKRGWPDAERSEGGCVNVATFHDEDGPGAHDAFERWRRDHPTGFFLNFGSPSDMVVHRTDCSHFIFRQPRSLTSYKKVCAERISDLEAWAARESSMKPTFCRRCSPRA